MGIPGLSKELTAEETALKKLYSELKKAKKQLQEHKAAKKQEQQALAAAHQGTKRSHSENAEEATAQAKKLLKAGAIKLEAENKEKKFKRTVVKKAKDSERPTSMFQPFVSASESPEQGYRPRGGGKQEFKNLYACFVSSGAAASSSSSNSIGAPTGGSGSSSSVGGPSNSVGGGPSNSVGGGPSNSVGGGPSNSGSGGPSNSGSGGPSSSGSSSKTLYVSGSGLTESLLKKAFSSYSSVVNVTMEQGKCSGFVTLADSHSADEAIERLNGSVFMDVALTVEIARRQQQPQPPSRSTSQTSLPGTPIEKGAAAWSELAQNRSKKGSDSMTDQRALVTYDESDIFS